MPAQIQVGGPALELVADEEQQRDVAAVETPQRSVRVDFSDESPVPAQPRSPTIGGFIGHDVRPPIRTLAGTRDSSSQRGYGPPQLQRAANHPRTISSVHSRSVTRVTGSDATWQECYPATAVCSRAISVTAMECATCSAVRSASEYE